MWGDFLVKTRETTTCSLVFASYYKGPKCYSFIHLAIYSAELTLPGTRRCGGMLLLTRTNGDGV